MINFSERFVVFQLSVIDVPRHSPTRRKCRDMSVTHIMVTHIMEGPLFGVLETIWVTIFCKANCFYRFLIGVRTIFLYFLKGYRFLEIH